MATVTISGSQASPSTVLAAGGGYSVFVLNSGSVSVHINALGSNDRLRPGDSSTYLTGGQSVTAYVQGTSAGQVDTTIQTTNAQNVLEGVAPVYRTHSFGVAASLGICSPGGDFQSRLGRRLSLGTATTYGLSSSRMVELWYDAMDTALAGSGSGAIAGSVAATDERGVVVIMGLTNDWLNSTATTGNTFSPASPTALRIGNWKNALTTIMALCSASSRIETETGTKTGVWTNQTAQNGYSGKTYNFTAAQNANYAVPVTFKNNGVAYHIALDLSAAAAGAATVAVDGVTQDSWASGTLFEQIKSTRGTGTTFVVGPHPSRLTATPGAHTVTITKTDASVSTPVYSDVILPMSDTPPLILVVKDPLPDISIATSPFITAQNVADMAATQATWYAAIDAVVAQFPNAMAVDCSDITGPANHWSVDGVHNNDPMNRAITDRIAAALITSAAKSLTGLIRS